MQQDVLNIDILKPLLKQLLEDMHVHSEESIVKKGQPICLC